MTPQRRETRKTHLDASVVPVEQALLARADALDKRTQHIEEIPWSQVAAEFRALAEELHHWDELHHW
jgi:hypothetical protein